jgi:hypothetical protein
MRRYKDMGLLDFNDDEILAERRLPAYGRRVRDVDNFEELQNLGHYENSTDFSDSPFADRQPKHEDGQ